MSKKSILLIMVVLGGLQSNVSFGSESSSTQPAQSWSSWFKNIPSTWWDWRKKQADQYTLHAVPAAVGVGAFFGINELIRANAQNLNLAAWVLANSPTMQNIDWEWNDKRIWGPAVAAFAGVVLVENILAYYRRKDIAREQAVVLMKKSISEQIFNDMMYPTRTAKLNALLKKDEFLVKEKDEDGILDQACNELIQEINQVKYDKDKDVAVDRQISSIKADLLKYSDLTQKMKELGAYDLSHFKKINTLSDLVDVMNMAEVKAALSVLLRLQRQYLVEENYLGDSKESRMEVRQEVAKSYKKIEKENENYNSKRTMTSEERAGYRAALQKKRAQKEQQATE